MWQSELIQDTVCSLLGSVANLGEDDTTDAILDDIVEDLRDWFWIVLIEVFCADGGGCDCGFDEGEYFVLVLMEVVDDCIGTCVVGVGADGFIGLSVDVLY